MRKLYSLADRLNKIQLYNDRVQNNYRFNFSFMVAFHLIYLAKCVRQLSAYILEVPQCKKFSHSSQAQCLAFSFTKAELKKMGL